MSERAKRIKRALGAGLGSHRPAATWAAASWVAHLGAVLCWHDRRPREPFQALNPVGRCSQAAARRSPATLLVR